MHIDHRARQQPDEERRQDRSKQSRCRRHADRKSQVAFSQIGDHIRSRSAWATADEDDAYRQFLRERESLGQSPCQQRHDGELREATDEDIFGTTQHYFEVIRRKGQSHAEHDDAQHRIDDPRADPRERRGHNKT